MSVADVYVFGPFHTGNFYFKSRQKKISQQKFGEIFWPTKWNMFCLVK